MKFYLLPFAMLAVLVLAFQNCGYFSTSGVFLSSSCGGASDADLLPAFQGTFHEFFIANNCNNCHTTGGPKGDSAFAAPDAASAFSVFNRIGPDGFRSKLSGGHQNYSWAVIQTDFDNARDGYLAAGGGGACEDGVNTTGGKQIQFFETTSLQDGDGVDYFPLLIDKLDIAETIEFRLDEPPFEPQLPGVTVQMEVSVLYSDSVQVPRRPTQYEVKNISVKSTESRLRVRGINVLLNGSNQSVTTFQNVNFLVLRGDFYQTVSGPSAGSFVMDNFRNTDLWQIQFNEIGEE